MNTTNTFAKAESRRSLIGSALVFYGVLPILILVSIYAGRQKLYPGETVFALRYGFGPVIRNLIQQHRFGSINETYGWWCYAGRMPIIPLLGALSYWVSPKAIVFLISKDVLFWCLWIYAFLRVKEFYNIPYKWALATLLLLLLAPYTLSIAGQVEIEEGFLFSLIAVLFSLLLTMRGRRDALVLGAVMAAIYLTKSSMLTLSIASTIWLLIKYRRRHPSLFVVPLTIMICAVIGWGICIHSVSGVFAVGADASSWNGWNFYKGNNSSAYMLYPRVNLDVLDKADYAHRLLPTTPVHSEWELSHAQLALGRKFAREQPSVLFKMDLKKLYVVCCDLGEAPQLSPGRTRFGAVLSNAVSHLTLGVVMVCTLVNIRRRRVTDAEILTALLMVGYLLPYFAGFVYARHLVPIYGLMAITASVQLSQQEGKWKTLRVSAPSRSGLGWLVC